MGRQFHQQAKQEIWQLLRGSLLINYHLRNKLQRLRCFQSLYGNKQRQTLTVIRDKVNSSKKIKRTEQWIQCKCDLKP